MWGVQTCKRRSSHSTQDYHSIKFRLLLVTLGCGGSVTAFCLLCCVVMCLLRLALFANVFPHSLQSNVVSVSNSSAAAHFHRRSFALTPESPLICWNSLTNDLICSVTNSCSASSLTFRRKSRRIVSTCFLSSSALQRVRKSWLNLPSWWVITACFTNWFGYFMKCDLEYDFRDLEKMPKHVEMVRTKCQPKSWDGQNANHKKSPDKMPTFTCYQTGFIHMAKPIG